MKSRHLDSELNKLQSAHEDKVKAHDQLQQDHEHVQRTRAEFEQENQQLKAALDELRGQHQNLGDEHEVHLEMRQKERDEHSEVTRLKDEMSRMIAEWKEIVDELQTKFVSTTRDYQKLAHSVRAMQQERLQEMDAAYKLVHDQQFLLSDVRKNLHRARQNHTFHSDDGERWRSEAERLEVNILALHEENRHAAGHLRSSNTEKERLKNSYKERDEVERKKQETLSQMRSKRFKILYPCGYERKFARMLAESLEVHAVRKIQGIETKKKPTDPKVAVRMMKIESQSDPKEHGGRQVVRIRWAVPAGKLDNLKWEDQRSVDLSHVHCLCFGHASRAVRLTPDETPERCFSIFTSHRSFDFICDNDTDAEMFVVVISRMAAMVQGHVIQGSLMSHSAFLAARGWCKVRSSCKAENSTMPRHFLKGIENSRRQPPADSGAGVASFMAAPGRRRTGPVLKKGAA